jgi:hypothetical protein
LPRPALRRLARSGYLSLFLFGARKKRVGRP